MSPRRGIRTGLRALPPAALLAAALACATPGAADAATTAVMLYLDARRAGDLPAPVAEVRAEAEAALADALTETGERVLAVDAVRPRLAERRARDARFVDRALLEDLRRDGADRILLVTLHAGADWRALGRRVVAATGRLEAAAHGEGSGADWREGLAAACRGLVARLPVAPRPVAGAPLLVTACDPVGFDAPDAAAATHALLAVLLDRGGRPLLDPAVLAADLAADGVDPRRVDADALARRAAAAGAAVALLPVLTSYGFSGGAAFAEDGDGDGSDLADFVLSVRVVDAVDGILIAHPDAYLETRDRAGWFGRVSDTAPLTHLRAAAERLWREIAPVLEDHPDVED